MPESRVRKGNETLSSPTGATRAPRGERLAGGTDRKKEHAVKGGLSRKAEGVPDVGICDRLKRIASASGGDAKASKCPGCRGGVG